MHRKNNQCSGWLDLKRDLSIAAHENYHTTASNCYVKSATGQKSQKFVSAVASHNKKPFTDMKVDADPQYCSTSLINNRKNNRPNGMSGPKRTKRYLHTNI